MLTSRRHYLFWLIQMKNQCSNPNAKLIRIPRPGTRCEYTKLSRSTIYTLISPNRANGNKPLVASHVVKSSRYSKRGIRLIDLESLLSYIKIGDGLLGSSAMLNPFEKA
jgi:hypothetical protein